MKKAGSILCVLALMMLLLSAAPMDVQAADWEYTFYGTVGNTEYFIITSNAYDEILEAKIYNGVVPGMDLDVAGSATLGLVGVPTSDGEFKVFITMKTRDLGEVDIKATVYINPATPSAGTPVVTKNPTGETVVAGESATFIAKADNVRQYLWQIAIADACIDVADLPGYIGKGVKVSGHDSEKLVISNIPESMNGAMVWCQFVGAEESVTSTAATIKVIAQKDATPVVTKSPTDETVEEGGEAVFVAKAKYAQTYLWQLVAPDGITYDCIDAPKTFGALKVSGADTERITLSNIPLSLDGYRIRCKFTAGDVVSSDLATLYVTPKPTEAPTEAPTETPTETPTEAPAPVPTEAPAEKSDPPADGASSNKGADKSNKIQKEPANDNGNTTLIIVAIISAAAVAIAGIAAFVILKLKTPKKS